MCEIKAAVVSISLVFLVAACICTYQTYTENKVRHHGENKSQNPCQKEYKKCCLNGGDCYYLVDEDIVGCNCTWIYGEKRFQKVHLVALD